MAVCSHILIEAAAALLGQLPQTEGGDDGPGAQVELLLHQGGEVGIADGARAEAFHQDAHRLGHANGIAELHFAFASQA